MLSKGCVFSWWLPIAFTATSAFLFTFERGFIFSLNFSTFAVESDWNKILKAITVFEILLEKCMGFSNKKTWNFPKSLDVAIFSNASQMVFFLKTGKLVDKISSPLWKEPLHEYFEHMMLTWFSFVDCLSNVFSPSSEVLLAENLKIKQCWKIWRKRIKKQVILEKKAFILPKSNFNKDGGREVSRR